jgi:DNA-binding XRE family transcriptional regulator
MKNKQDISLHQWGKQFSVKQKKAAAQANNYYEVVAEFKRARQELGLTQQAIADRIGIDRSTIAKIESGERNTTISSLMMLAEAMDKKLKINFV